MVPLVVVINGMEVRRFERDRSWSRYPMDVARLAIVAVIGLAACGRLGFDALGRGDSGADDDANALCTLGHDEDGDGVDDCSDVCPHISDDEQLDRDGDGVGNDCDTRPDEAGERVMIFDPFTTMRPDDWLYTGGAAISSDELTLPGDVGEQFAGIRRPLDADTTDIVIWEGTIDAVSAGATQHVMIEIGSDDGIGLYYCELLSIQASGEAQVKYAWTLDSVDYFSEPPADLGVQFLGPVTLEMRRSNSSVECNGIVNGVSGQTTGAIPDGVFANEMRLMAQAVSARARYIHHQRSP